MRVVGGKGFELPTVLREEGTMRKRHVGCLLGLALLVSFGGGYAGATATHRDQLTVLLNDAPGRVKAPAFVAPAPTAMPASASLLHGPRSLVGSSSTGGPGR